MVSGAKPQQNFCLLCLRISSILGHFVVNSNIWLLIDVKIKPSKLLILQQYTTEQKKDYVAEDCNIKNSVWGKAPAKFWELCLRMLSKLKHFLLWCLTFNVVKIKHFRLLKQYMCIWRWRYMGQSTMWLRNAISRLGFGAKPQRNVEYLLAILSI